MVDSILPSRYHHVPGRRTSGNGHGGVGRAVELVRSNSFSITCLVGAPAAMVETRTVETRTRVTVPAAMVRRACGTASACGDEGGSPS